jgi:hypothetical protein
MAGAERHQNNSLKMVIAFAHFLGLPSTFYDLDCPEQIIPFLDTKIKSADPARLRRTQTQTDWTLDRLECRAGDQLRIMVTNLRPRTRFSWLRWIEGDELTWTPTQPQQPQQPQQQEIRIPWKIVLNKHPFKNTSEARLICNLQNGAPIKPDSICMVMKQLRHRIIRMEYLLRTKKWNPFCYEPRPALVHSQVERCSS